MIQDKIYTFLFHPLSYEHTSWEKGAAVLTLLALSVLTGGIFLIAFGAVQWRDRNISVKKGQTPASKIAKERLPSSPEKIPAPLKPLKVKKTPAQVKAALVKSKHAEQLKKFEEWAKKGKWGTFHSSHYDWWMFPISRSSSAQGDRYAIYQEEIRILKADAEFMDNYRRGVELVALSWGWKVNEKQLTENPTKEQKWANWPVRLGKMADSLRLFGEEELRESMKAYALNHAPYDRFEKWVKNALGISS